jgi:hypothetical protein
VADDDGQAPRDRRAPPRAHGAHVRPGARALAEDFSAREIAAAFLESTPAVEKRVARAKKALASSHRLFDVGEPGEVATRLPVVHRALYLLFNEGYHGASPESAVRVELCQEAMRLISLLLEHPSGQTAATRALAALMCLHAARMPSRLDSAGDLTPFFDQDRSLWDADLIAQGRRLLHESAAGAEITTYHLEAAIAAVHALSPSARETDWGAIVGLYDALLAARPSPVVALHRAIAVAQQEGPSADWQRWPPSHHASASRPTPSTRPRSPKWSSAAAASSARGSISSTPSPWPATRRSAGPSRSAWRPATAESRQRADWLQPKVLDGSELAGRRSRERCGRLGKIIQDSATTAGHEVI